MGTMQHHAMIFTSYDEPIIMALHMHATRLFGRVSPIHETEVNSYFSFAILPDGSKEGWEMSNDYDAKREKMAEMVSFFQDEDGGNPVDWCEVSFGEMGLNVVRGHG